MLPQLRLMQNTKVRTRKWLPMLSRKWLSSFFNYIFVSIWQIVEPFTAHYVFALGVARFLSCAHWVLQVWFWVEVSSNQLHCWYLSYSEYWRHLSNQFLLWSCYVVFLVVSSLRISQLTWFSILFSSLSETIEAEILITVLLLASFLNCNMLLLLADISEYYLLWHSWSHVTQWTIGIPCANFRDVILFGSWLVLRLGGDLTANNKSINLIPSSRTTNCLENFGGRSLLHELLIAWL